MDLMFLMNSGLKDISNKLINNWIGPVFLLIVAAVAVKFVVNKQWRELAVTVLIAAVASVLIFAGGDLFGKGKGLTKSSQDLIKQVDGGSANTILSNYHIDLDR